MDVTAEERIEKTGKEKDVDQYLPVYRIALVRDGRQRLDTRKVASPEEVVDLVRRYQGEPDREVFVVLILSTKNEVIGINTVSIGTLDAALVHPREVFKPAVLLNAAAVILAHNHLSGDATPSAEDKVTTAWLVQAGKVLGIGVLDHLVLGATTFFSLRQHDLI